MDLGLSGRSALVTGGSSGIGEAVATELAREGTHVAIIGRSLESLKNTESRIRTSVAAAGVIPIVADVASGDQVRAAVTQVEAKCGHIDFLVNCAGITQPGFAVDMSEAQFDRVLHVNAKGTFLCCQAVGRGMLSRGSGAIVNVASINAFGGQTSRVNYTASKAAILGITRTLAIEWGRLGIRVNAVAPQLIDTPMIRQNVPLDFLTEVVCDRTPLGRLGRPSDVADVILFLLSNRASYLTGTTVVIDGGLQAGFLTSHSGSDGAFGNHGHA